jgi:glucokinase
MLLVGDVGGTKTILALFSREHGAHKPLVEARFNSDDFASLETIIEMFLADKKIELQAACIGVAGPVRQGRVQVTNLPWIIDSQIIRQRTGVPVTLLNDLEAIANAVPVLEAGDLALLKPGEAGEREPIAIVAPGTGLGEAYLYWSGDSYRAIPTEGGHTDFGPATPLELELLTYLMPRLGHVSYEKVCSGIGIPNIYAFLRDSGRYEEPDWLSKALVGAEDDTPIIVQAALKGDVPICGATLDLFMAILGSEAGNLVLQLLATGGVYLAGGIPPRILPQLKSGIFLEAFTRKGRFSKLLAPVPVYVVLNSNAALYGAAGFGLRMLAAE